MGWLASAALREAKLLRKLLKIVTYLTDGYGTITGVVDAEGNTITGLASYTWSDFTAGGFDLTVARYVHVTDKHSTRSATATPGSLWWVEPTATSAYKRQLVSGSIYCATFAAGIAAFPAASYPGIKLNFADLRNAEYYSDATNFLPSYPQVIYDKNFGTIASPTVTVAAASTGFSITGGAPKIPAHLMNSSSRFSVEAWVYKSGGVGGAGLNMYLGTAGDSTDQSISTATLASADKAYARLSPEIKFTSNTALLTTYNSIRGGNGSTLGLFGGSTKINVASDMFVSLRTAATYSSPDILQLVSLTITQVS